MKILIIDDEKIILEKLQLCVSKLFTSNDIILTSSDANKGLEIIKEEHPDIILSDIRMPLKSGLDIASYVHDFLPDKIVILITGYSDFKYAQTAIQNQVFDYILKPIDEKILSVSIKRAIHTINDRNNQMIMQKKYNEYFNGNLKNLQKEFFERLLFRSFTCEAAKLSEEIHILQLSHIQKYYLLSCECLSSSNSRRLEKEYYFIHITDHYIKEDIPGAITFSYGNILYSICPDITEKSLTKTIHLIHGELKKNGMLIHAAISNISESLSEIPILRQQTQDIFSNLRASGHYILFYKDLDISPVSAVYKKSNYFQALLNTFSSCDSEMILDRFNEISEQMKNDGPQEFNNFMYSFMTLFFSFFKASSPELSASIYQITESGKEAFEACSDDHCKKNIFTRWITQIAQTLYDEKASKHSYLTKQILDYIYANYQSPISLYNIADEFHRSTPYLSRLIKQATNKNFTELLTNLRIEKAKELLKTSSLHINEISEQVGYLNFRYFSRIFKQETGMTPIDYRKVACRFR